ncbi:hypothetical protein Tco_0329109 [Tanacetum coccineum]
MANALPTQAWSMASMDFSSQLRLHQLLYKKDVVIGLPNRSTSRIKYVPLVKFDEIKEMFETSVANDTSGLVPQRQNASDYDNPDPAPELQNSSPSADTTVPSQQELDILFGPLYDEFFNDGNSRVNKSSSPTDNSTQQDTPPTTNIHPTSELLIPCLDRFFT